MTGIRLINSPPETFRFPEWRDDIFYAADSLVRYASYMSINDSDSDLRTRFYIAMVDVKPGTGIPTANANVWAEVAASSISFAQIAKDVLDNDSDIIWLRGSLNHIKLEADSDKRVLRADMDSEIRILDSDIRYDMDSDLLARKQYDSDFKATYDSDLLAQKDYNSNFKVDYDSDLNVSRRFDSDVKALIGLPSWDYGSTF